MLHYLWPLNIVFTGHGNSVRLMARRLQEIVNLLHNEVQIDLPKDFTKYSYL